MEYLYEMHAHTKEVSNCAVATAKDLVESYKGTEYKGIVLTNHLNEMTFKRIHMEDASWDEKIDHFLSGYNILKKEAGGRFNVLLGVEINFYNTANDYLVYGVTEEFLRSNGDLMAMDLEELSKITHENGLLLVQAHPFRRDMEVADWKLLDGYEIFNGNPRHYSSNEIAEEWAKFHNKSLVLSGSDFHEIEDAGIGGVYFNKEIKTNGELLEELKAGNYRVRKVDFKHTREE
ncbi:MAG: PHP domain-containing protein [Clostridia bacterium]|nr:PHP domain-containing protein [Clostridia bacterium]